MFKIIYIFIQLQTIICNKLLYIYNNYSKNSSDNNFHYFLQYKFFSHAYLLVFNLTV